MKRYFTLLIAVLLCLTFAGCNTDSNTESKPDTLSSATNDTSQTSIDSNNDIADSIENEKKILIAYFSCTGTTEQVAKYIESAMQADLYRITPEVPYTSADLDYNDSSTRATKEQQDASARPAISGTIENISDYDVIFIGYPIWWGEAPKIIYTFLESYNFSGKTMIPFCTSSSSGIGSSDAALHSLCEEDTEWLSGKRFSRSSTENEVMQWVNGLELPLS